MGVRRVPLPLARHQDRKQQPVRPGQHKPQGVQEGPEAGEESTQNILFILNIILPT